ncbi:hypothetical protein LguiA_012439 [Lonicera macranthoides]
MTGASGSTSQPPQQLNKKASGKRKVSQCDSATRTEPQFMSQQGVNIIKPALFMSGPSTMTKSTREAPPILHGSKNHKEVLIKFRVFNVAVSAFNITSSKITGEWACQFFIRNPNKFNVSYSSFTSTLSYKYEDIAQKSIPPFSLPKKSEMILNIIYVAKDVDFSNKEAALRRLEAELDSGDVTFSPYFNFAGNDQNFIVNCHMKVGFELFKGWSGKVVGNNNRLNFKNARSNLEDIVEGV